MRTSDRLPPECREEIRLVTLDDVRAEISRCKKEARDLHASAEELWVRVGTASYLLEKLGQELPFACGGDKAPTGGDSDADGRSARKTKGKG